VSGPCRLVVDGQAALEEFSCFGLQRTKSDQYDMFTWSHYPPASVIGELFFKPVKTYYAETWSQNVKKKKIP
jgi:hypothetical protein